MKTCLGQVNKKEINEIINKQQAMHLYSKLIKSHVSGLKLTLQT